ncbi:MAG TPA: VanZ family protein [Gaiellaceae bacterium]|jgi:VanZ family protein
MPVPIRRPHRQSRRGLSVGVASGASGALSLWLPVVVWAAVIFTFSAIPSLTTGLGTWDTLLRKAAHFTEYAILGALLLRALGRELPAFAAGVLYAASDEVHQHFVRGRHASPVDVLIDAVGIALGIYVFRRLSQTGLGDRPRGMAVADIPLQNDESRSVDISQAATSEGQSPGHGS